MSNRMIPADIRQTIAEELEIRQRQVQLSMSGGGYTSSELYAKWTERLARIDAALAFIRQQQHAPQPSDLHAQHTVSISTDTLGAILAYVDDPHAETARAITRLWVQQAAEEIGNAPQDAPQPQPVAPDAAGVQPDSIKDDIGLCAAAVKLAYHRKTHDHIDHGTMLAAERIEKYLGRR